MFKKGDKVEKVDGTDFSNGEYIVTVERVDSEGKVWLSETDSRVRPQIIKLVTNPRPHSELIKAWAYDGSAVVQCRDPLETFPVWSDVMGTPSWFDNLEYRIKPEKSEVDERIEALEAELMALKEARRKEKV